MKIIKLSATDSTNSFLKDLSRQTTIDNYTVVTASYQKKGKGQQGSKWLSEPNMNLLCSVFVRFDAVLAKQQLLLNYAVSLAVFKVLKSYDLPRLTIKWPNDILSSNKKLCGILIENAVQKGRLCSTIIGIGINVNQLFFSTQLNEVCSMKQLLDKEIDIDSLLIKIVKSLKDQLRHIEVSTNKSLKKNYLQVLYRKGVPSMFKNHTDNSLFMGMIVGISDSGNLQIQLEDDSQIEFGIKAISFA